MKRALSLVILLLMMASLAGCGGNDHGFPVVTTQILSDPAYDGDIRQDAFSGAFTVTQGNTQSVFAGINPSTGAEYRAFLDFPLTGSGGVPGDAYIVSAFLDFFLAGIQPQPLVGTLPIRIDLVSFQPLTLVDSDFSRALQPALASVTISPPISQTDLDAGKSISVDVTTLMLEAQRLGLRDFQVRILQDSAGPGIIEIDDPTGLGSSARAPLLQVSYR